MTIHWKDAFINQLQRRNIELQNYVSNLQRMNGVQAEYKGGPLSESQNKKSTIKQ